MSKLRRTPLYEAHVKLGGRLVEFGGWEMPVQYPSIIDEHLAVRRDAGLFDISHMGEVFVNGLGAEAFLNEVLTNDVRRLAVGKGQYTLMCNDRGGVVDDLYAYRLGALEYLLIVNASRIAADVAWLGERREVFPRRRQVEVDNASDRLGALAVQGPRVVQFIDQVFPGPPGAGTAVARPTALARNRIASFPCGGKPVWVARTGYTGEDGFEIVAPASALPGLWERLLAVGHWHCLQPAGLGARDTLRTEMCYPLYGHELDEETTPLEAGLGAFVALDKGRFVGREALEEQQAGGVGRKLAAFRMTGKSAPPRPGYPVWSTGPEGQAVGRTVSGTLSPSLNAGIGLAYVPPELAAPGTAIEIEIRGRRAPAEVVAKPIYRKPAAPAAKAV